MSATQSSSSRFAGLGPGSRQPIGDDAGKAEGNDLVVRKLAVTGGHVPKVLEGPEHAPALSLPKISSTGFGRGERDLLPSLPISTLKSAAFHRSRSSRESASVLSYDVVG